VQAGWHELPLAKVDVQVPTTPFDGGLEASQVLAAQVAVDVRVPLSQVVLPTRVYPESHVGKQVLPLAKVLVQLPALRP